MAENRLSSVGMSVRSTFFAVSLRGICLLAAVFGLMFLASALAPGTLPASAVANVYTEEPPPQAPKPDRNQTGNNGGQTGGGDGNSGGGGGTSSSGGGGDSAGGSSGTGGSGTDGSGSNAQPNRQYSDGNYNPAVSGQDRNRTGATGADDESDAEDEAGAIATSGGDDGGSALPWIIAILVGVPLVAGGGYYLWRRYQTPDDETREKLKAALGGKSVKPGSGQPH